MNFDSAKAATLLNNWGVLRGRKACHYITEVLTSGHIRTACGMSRDRKVKDVDPCENGVQCQQCQIALVTGQKACKLRGSRKNREAWEKWKAENGL